MKNLKSTTLALLTTTCIASVSFSSMAMDPYIENALIETCIAAKSNSILRYNKTAKSYHLKDKTVALKVMCNGDDIIKFAQKHGADKTAAKLQRSIGNVNIIDVAAIYKINVTFEE